MNISELYIQSVLTEELGVEEVRKQISNIKTKIDNTNDEVRKRLLIDKLKDLRRKLVSDEKMLKYRQYAMHNRG